MDIKKIDFYKAKLESQFRLLSAEIEKNQNPPDFGKDIDGFDEETDEAEAFNDQLAIAQDLKSRLADTSSALNKIESGTYGLCENCHREISESVLAVDPESRLCHDCKLTT